MKLYELAQSIRALIERADDDGVLPEHVVEALDMLEGELDFKAESVALAVKEIEAEAEAVAKEAKRLEDRRDATRNRAARLRDYLSHWLDGRSVKGKLVSIGWRKSEAVEITDAKVVPLLLCRVRDPEPDKAAIKELLKRGETVEGAVLVERSHMRIY